MKRTATLQLCTAGATETVVESADIVKAIREAGTTFQTCIASIEDCLDEPLKSKFMDVKKQINLMLSGLPETDKVPAALASNDMLRQLLGTLSMAQMMISNLNETAKASGMQMASLRASMPEDIKAAIATKVTAGELVEKATHEQALADARSAAMTAARESAVAELSLMSARKLQLTTASIPVPEDKFLAGEEKDFEAHKTTAAKRVDELKKFKLPAERVVALAWATADDSYASTLSLLNTAFDAAGVKPGANGFINRTAADTKPSNKPTGVC